MHRITRALLIGVVVTFAALPVAAAPSDAGCQAGSRDKNAVFNACTRLIQGRGLHGAALGRAYATRALVLARNGEYQRAIADMDAALGAHPGEAKDLVSRGIYKHEVGDFDGAIADDDAALAIAPSGDAYANRGAALLEKTQYAAALQDFKLALEFKPDAPDYLLRRAYAWRSLGQYDRAVLDLDEAAKHPPVDPQTLCDRGISHFYDGSFKAAAADLGRCPREDELYIYMRIWRYIALARAGGDEVAIRAELDSGAATPGAWPGQVRAMLLGRITPEALLAAAAAADPSKPDLVKGQNCEANFYVGEYHLIRGETAPARPFLTQALAICSERFLEYQGAVAALKVLGQ